MFADFKFDTLRTAAVGRWLQANIFVKFAYVLLVAVVIIVAGWVVSFLAWAVGLQTAWVYAEQYSQILAQFIPMNEQLLTAFTYLLFLIFVPIATLFLSWNRKHWQTGITVLAVIGVIFYGGLGFLTNNHLVSPVSELPIKCVVKVDGKNVLYDIVPGRKLIDPFGRPCVQVTNELAARISRTPPNELSFDSSMDFFDRTDGSPKVWYSRSSDGAFRLFDNEGVDPTTQEELLPVTPDIVRDIFNRIKYEAERIRTEKLRVEEEDRQRKMLEKEEIERKKNEEQKNEEEKVLRDREQHKKDEEVRRPKEKEDGLQTEKTVFVLDQGDRELKSFRLEAEKGSADIKWLSMVYVDGVREQVSVGQLVAAGQRTTLFRMKKPRPVKYIEVSYVSRGTASLALLTDNGRTDPPQVKWVDLGCKSVGFLVDKDSLIFDKRSYFKALRLRSWGNDVEVMEMLVQYSGGERDKYEVRSVISKGSLTGPINLRGERRRLTQIDFLYRARAIGTVKTKLCVEGLADSGGDDEED